MCFKCIHDTGNEASTEYVHSVSPESNSVYVMTRSSQAWYRHGIDETGPAETQSPVQTGRFSITLRTVSIAKFSSILEDCKRYTKHELANSISKLFPEKNKNSAYLSALFCNIDGFASNFDSFLIEHKTLPCNFDVIGLAATNIDPSQQGLYLVPSYTTFCQVPFPDKKKGTGVSLYVSDRLNAVVIENLTALKILSAYLLKLLLARVTN